MPIMKLLSARSLNPRRRCNRAEIRRTEELMHRRLIPINTNPNLFLYHHVHNF